MIIISRFMKTTLYTEGRVIVNGLRQTFCVEATNEMLPVGEYVLKLVSVNPRRRELQVYSANACGRARFTGWRLGCGHSWRSSKKRRTVTLGEICFPGAVKLSQRAYERIVKRLEKCKERGETILLQIRQESTCQEPPIQPNPHWLSGQATPPLTPVERETDSAY